MNVAARAGTIGGKLGHEGDAHARGLGDFLEALLEDGVAVGHLEDAGVAHVDLMLAAAPFSLRSLDGHAGVLEVAAYDGVEALGARALEKVIVLEIPAGGLEAAVTLAVGVAVAGAKEVMLELGGRQAFKAGLARLLDLPAQDRARRHADAFQVADDERGLVEP